MCNQIEFVLVSLKTWFNSAVIDLKVSLRFFKVMEFEVEGLICIHLSNLIFNILFITPENEFSLWT